MRPESSAAKWMGTQDSYHVPVMLQESVDFLLNDPAGTYIDGTLGGGGHTAMLLERLGPDGRVIAFDADRHAIEHCRQRFHEELAAGSAGRLRLRNENFQLACSLEEDKEIPCLAGLLLDLGVSSKQLDTGNIGLSYRVDSRLDMRFGSHGRTAEDLLATTTVSELERILRLYGEEPHASKIARRLVEGRRAAPILSTFDLRRIIETCVPQQQAARTLSRVFQAIRIAINDELGILETTLRCIIPMLCPAGRIVVLSYHSLEDRIVKTVFKEAARSRVPDPGNPRSGSRAVQPQLRILTKRPLLPSAAEITANPRARSAKLRVAEKCS